LKTSGLEEFCLSNR